MGGSCERTVLTDDLGLLAISLRKLAAKLVVEDGNLDSVLIITRGEVCYITRRRERGSPDV